MNLSPNFTVAEIQCPCGCGDIGINPRLIAALQRLRDALGKPVHVLSACRCPKHNRAIGGATYSQHLLGTAADICVHGMSARELYEHAHAIPEFTGIGVDDARGFVHVDVRDEPARWCYSGGKQIPWFEKTGGAA